MPRNDIDLYLSGECQRQTPALAPRAHRSAPEGCRPRDRSTGFWQVPGHPRNHLQVRLEIYLLDSVFSQPEPFLWPQQQAPSFVHRVLFQPPAFLFARLHVGMGMAIMADGAMECAATHKRLGTTDAEDWPSFEQYVGTPSPPPGLHLDRHADMKTSELTFDGQSDDLRPVRPRRAMGSAYVVRVSRTCTGTYTIQYVKFRPFFDTKTCDATVRQSPSFPRVT